MDWYTWLSKTNLDSSLIYEYSRTFSRNELEQEDISHFNHEFLQSMGVSIAKHRLEILKVSKKEKPKTLNKPSNRLLNAYYKTRDCIVRCKNLLVHREYASAIVVVPRPPVKKVERLKRSKKTAVTRKVTQEKSPQMIKAGGFSPRGMIPLVFEDGFGSGSRTESIRWDSMFQGLKPT
ncbi:hypothetical protein LUZ60_002984 [Juncus effusus]|nr:hypothetical protein LUZ60_002984 [Juncus effusus]